MKKLLLLLYLSILINSCSSFSKSNRNTKSSFTDSLVYDMWVDNSTRGKHLANGWRNDTITGNHRRVYFNPFPSLHQILKKKAYNNYQYFFFKDGRRYNGILIDSSFTKSTTISSYLKVKVINGKPEGKVIFYSGKVQDSLCYFEEGNFVNGEAIGIWKRYDSDGILYFHAEYLHNRSFPAYLIIYDYDNITEVYYKDDYIIEKRTVRYNNGELKESLMLDSILYQGVNAYDKKVKYHITRYYRNGNTKEKGFEIHDNLMLRKQGKWHYYDENGNLLKIE